MLVACDKEYAYIVTEDGPNNIKSKEMQLFYRVGFEILYLMQKTTLRFVYSCRSKILKLSSQENRARTHTHTQHTPHHIVAGRTGRNIWSH